MSKGVTKNTVFFRIDDDTQNKLNQIKDDYQFRSIAELGKTIIKVFCAIYGNFPKSEETIESEIADAFTALENGDFAFEYQKPKRRLKINSDMFNSGNEVM